MRTIVDGVHVLDQPLRFFGLEMGTRMTVIDTGEGLLVHSPVNVDPASIAELGEARWVLAPNKFHHLFVGRWIDSGLEGWGAPGLPEKRSDVAFHGVPETGTHPFGPDIEIVTMTCLSLTNEVVLFHKPSRTLVVTDLVIHYGPDAPWLTRAAMFCACAYPGCQASAIEKVGMKRSVAREEIRAIHDFDFERIILAHGDIIERDARGAFAEAYRWLGFR